MNKLWHYYYSGLWVASEFEIPEWAAFRHTEPSSNTDIQISIDTSILPTGLDDHQPVIQSGEIRFTVDSVGTYAVRDGQEIRLNPHPGAELRELRLFTLGTAWGTLCYQRGFLVLHASVVGKDDGAVAFSGPAGAGKSTLAAGLIQCGHLLVGDDLCRFDVDDQIKLWFTLQPHASNYGMTPWNFLGGESQPLERDHFRSDKYHLDWPGKKAVEVLPLKAFYLLDWGELCLKRLTGLASLQKLVETATYRGSFLKPMGLLPAYWTLCKELVQHIPVYQLTRPRDLSKMDEVVEYLENHWKGSQHLGSG